MPRLADMSLRWAHIHFFFSFDMSWLKYSSYPFRHNSSIYISYQFISSHIAIKFPYMVKQFSLFLSVLAYRL